MNRTPIPLVQLRPGCFGLSYRAADHECKTCTFADRCKVHVGFWDQKQSLAGAAAGAKFLLRTASKRDREGDDDPVKVYETLYAQIFGTPLSRYVPRYKITRACVAAHKLCRDEGYDVATYMAAQMEGIKPLLPGLRNSKGRPLGFQPNMLLGRKALVRYGTFVAAARQRYGQVGEHVFSQAAYSRAVWDECVLGEDLLLRARSGEEIPDDPKGYVGGLQMAARLEAACATAELAMMGLSERMGFHPPFVWSEFIAFVVGVVGKSAPRDRQIATLPVGEADIDVGSEYCDSAEPPIHAA